MSEKEIEEYINYARDGLDALSSEWPEEAKKDAAAIKETLTQVLAELADKPSGKEKLLEREFNYEGKGDGT